MKKDRGFTLIELMVVVIVIAVLAAIALPSYLNQTRKSRRSQVEGAMQQIALLQERFRADCTTYATGFGYTCPVGTTPPTFPALTTVYPSATYYTVDMPAPSASATIAYTIRAVPTATGKQNQDKASGTPCTVLYYTFGVDTAVNTACSLTSSTIPPSTAAGAVTKCPAACWSQQ